MTKVTPTTVTPKETPVRARKRPTKAVAKPIEQSDNLHEPLSTGANYTLESQNLIVELRRIRDNALVEIEAIKADQISIHERANRDMQTIADRAKAEIDARGLRVSDLMRSIALIDGGLTSDPGMSTPPETHIEVLSSGADSVDNEQ